MANVSTTIKRIYSATATDSSGTKIGFLNSATKASQNDTVTITNASEVLFAGVSIDATGASETNTISGNVVTLTSATTGAVSGLIIYR